MRIDRWKTIFLYYNPVALEFLVYLPLQGSGVYKHSEAMLSPTQFAVEHRLAVHVAAPKPRAPVWAGWGGPRCTIDLSTFQQGLGG